MTQREWTGALRVLRGTAAAICDTLRPMSRCSDRAGQRALTGRTRAERMTAEWVVRQPRQAGPSSALRSPISAGRRVDPQAVVDPQHGGARGRLQPQVHLGGARMGGEHLLEPLDHRRGAAHHRQRDHHRAARPLGEVGQRELHGDQLGHVVAPVQPALDHDHRVLGQRGREQVVGLREEHDLDRTLEVLDRGDRPDVALLGDLALQPADQATDRDVRAVRPVVRAGERGDRAVRRRGQDVLDPEQRVVGDVEAEHLPLVLRAGRSCPTPRSAPAGSPRASRRRGCRRRH